MNNCSNCTPKITEKKTYAGSVPKDNTVLFGTPGFVAYIIPIFLFAHTTAYAFFS